MRKNEWLTAKVDADCKGEEDKDGVPEDTGMWYEEAAASDCCCCCANEEEESDEEGASGIGAAGGWREEFCCGFPLDSCFTESISDFS